MLGMYRFKEFWPSGNGEKIQTPPKWVNIKKFGPGFSSVDQSK